MLAAHAQVRRFLEPVANAAQKDEGTEGEPSQRVRPSILLGAAVFVSELSCMLARPPPRIKFQMELFNLHIQQGRDLCSKVRSTARPRVRAR